MFAVAAILVAALHAAPAARVPDVHDLPLVEDPSPKPGRELAVMITGDGGWAPRVRKIAKGLTDAGVSVVALSSPDFFRKARTPDETAAAVARILAHYRAAWGRPEALLVGYSRGADVLPFVAGRLPPAAREGLEVVALIGPSTYAEFHFHLIDLVRSIHRKDALSTESAIRASGGARMLCFEGADEKDSVCPRVADLPSVKRVVLPGGHGFDNELGQISRAILESARRRG